MNKFLQQVCKRILPEKYSLHNTVCILGNKNRQYETGK